jgi:hypothetical protein
VLFPDGKVLRWEHDDAGLEVAQYVDDALLARIDRDPRTRTVTMTDHTFLPAFTHGLPLAAGNSRTKHGRETCSAHRSKAGTTIQNSSPDDRKALSWCHSTAAEDPY